MSEQEQRRAFVLTRLLSGEMGVTEAAGLLGLSERSIRRRRARVEQEGPAGLFQCSLIAQLRTRHEVLVRPFIPARTE